VADAFHVFAIEWQPDHIAWFIDGFQYFEASPADADLQGKQWVFNHPFFLLLNVAVAATSAGRWAPRPSSPEPAGGLRAALPGQARPVNFDASFLDDFTGWREVTVPFSAFVNGTVRRWT